MNSNDKSYNEFFKEDIYEGFVQHLLSKYTNRQIINQLRKDPLVTKKGVHYHFRRDFNVFLGKNPHVARRFANEHYKFMGMRNIANENLKFPIDTSDEGLMITEGIRTPKVLLADLKFARAKKNDKHVSIQAEGVTLFSGTIGRNNYLSPKKLVVHFTSEFSREYGKTTESFMIESKSDAMHIILNRFNKGVKIARLSGQSEPIYIKRR